LTAVFAATALAVAGCAGQEEMVAAVEEPSLNLDLKGGSYLLLQLEDGSTASFEDGMLGQKGTIVSCAELKTRIPALFQPSENRGPLFDEDCQATK
jgi:hypothetical protein